MSDTIIMYENGKAIGGEGHPTNADEITFNNEDTDLVSEEVESAIKEVNAKFDRGSVSVTADGVKTYGALFNELYSLIDFTKITHKSVLIFEGSNTSYIYAIEKYTTSSARFTLTSCDDNKISTNTYTIANNSSTAYTIRAATDGTTSLWLTNSVATNGAKFTVIY